MTINLFGVKIVLRKELGILLIIVLILIFGAVGYWITQSSDSVKFVSGDNEINQTGSITASKTDASLNSKLITPKPDIIQVYVVGCVKKPRTVVNLEKGQLVCDAIIAAGGATKEADLDHINLAYKLTENVMLDISSKEEYKLKAKEAKTTEPPKKSEAGEGIIVIKDSGGAIVNPPPESEAEENGGLVNINKASAKELDEKLPGVGEATAADIISYRETSGGFKTIEDIMKVPRIKEGRFSSIKDLITVGE